jgi:hypothetical protein
MTPLDKVEVLYQELVRSYGTAKDADIRASSKLLMVALYNLKQHAGNQWHALAMEYLDILQQDPARFERFMQSNRSVYEDQELVIPIHRPGTLEA